MIRLSSSLFAAGLLLVALAPVNHIRAGDGNTNACASGNNACTGGNNACTGGNACGGGCGGGCGHNSWSNRMHQRYEPSITYYAPVPYWYPNYFGPPYTSYQLCQYHTPPDISAQNVKARIMAINSANPALLPPPKEPLPFPKSDTKPPVEKLP